MFIEDLSSHTYAPNLHSNVRVCSVGWLGDNVPRTGATSTGVIGTLQHFNAFHYVDDGDLGYHECGLCRTLGIETFSRAEFWIETNAIRFVLPRLVIHYITAHQYLLPPEFISVVEKFWLSEDCARCRNGECSKERVGWDGLERLRRKDVLRKKQAR